ncbi:MAG: ABC transporter ATP-binding protein [Glaciecola sp.]
MEQHATILCCDALSKHYGNIEAVNQLSFDITQPGVYAILGKNGAGKTSLIKCALGLEPCTTGSIQIFGHTAGSMQAKLRTGVILQDSDLPDLLTIREQLMLFSSYYPTPLDIDATIKQCDLGEFIDRRYKHLSGGQKRRAQFALAVIGNPDLIFLDEPTTGLDVDARRTLWSVIREFANNGKTIVLTTHYLEEAENLADNIMVMASGKVVANDTVDKLKEQAQGSIIKCDTVLSETQIQALPNILDVSVSGRFTHIQSSQANTSLAALLQADPNLTDLSVNQPKLEDLFEQLSTQGEQA